MPLFCCGSNSHGQLGIGNNIDAIEWSLVGNLNDLLFIGGGGSHTIAVTATQVLSCGSNADGQLGIYHCDYCYTFTPVIEVSNDPVVSLACGWSHSVVGFKKHVIVFGSNKFGQLGVGNTTSMSFYPVTVSIPLDREEVKKIACGLRHSLVLTSRGRLFGFGWNKYGQLGIKNAPCVYEPTLVAENIKDVSAGEKHTIILNVDGHMSMWGRNFLPSFDVTVSQLFSGWSHCILTLENGQMLSFGKNNYGQCGINPLSPSQSKFNVPSLNNAPIVCAQVASGAEHHLCLTADNRLISWGWNEHGNCGNGRRSISSCLQEIFLSFNGSLIRGSDVQLIGCGYGHSFVYLV